MRFEPVQFSIQGNLEAATPRMIKIRQKFSSQQVDDPTTATHKTLESLGFGRLDGKRIAITAGSRRIANLPLILRATGKHLRNLGATPFVVPAMGSHGSATADGQREMLAHLGITEETTGLPIISQMEADPIGQLEGGCTIYCSRTILEADGVVVCNRIKPHTSISGQVESGLCKMMVVGMGKHLGATAFHRQGYHKLAEILPQGGALFLEKIPILCGLGIVENAFDQTMHIEAVKPEELIGRESELLKIAKANMPRFFLDEIDVLVVDQMGKDISGGGMDPNITGRAISPLPREVHVPIHCIVVLDLTAASHGNATGIGAADITTRQVVEKIDFGSTYTNVFTSGALTSARLPVVLNHDADAIRAAVCCAPREKFEDVKVVHIKDTLHMAEIEVSENYLPLINGDKRIEILSEAKRMQFNVDGRLLSC
jgi:Uncharacterized conserved protein (DUF2088).